MADLLAQAADLEDAPAALRPTTGACATALTVASGNPIYTLILNGFAGFYVQMAHRYFTHVEARRLRRLLS